MTIYMKEMKKGSKNFLIWAGAISVMMVICIFIYPDMKGEMDGMNEMFSNMGAFTEAFGMDQLNFGTLIGFYGIECGNVVGLGGGLFAAYLGITMISKEEKDHTAEFLLTHPVSRATVLWQKMSAVVSQIVLLNVLVVAFGFASIVMIGEDLPTKELLLIHGGYLFLQLELGLVCFGISAFLRRGSVGIGLGIAGLMYFLSLIQNISEDAKFLKYITPYSYADAADIVAEEALEWTLIAIGAVYAVIAVVCGFAKYTRKDMAA